MDAAKIVEWMASLDPICLGFFTGVGAFLLGDRPDRNAFPDAANPTRELAEAIPKMRAGWTNGYIFASTMFTRKWK